MDKCISVAQKDKCPNGQMDSKCVFYTGPTLNNIGVVSGDNIEEVSSKINSAIGGGAPSPVKIVSLSLSSSGTYSLPAGGWLMGIALQPSSTLSAFKIGTTFDGNEIIFDQLILSGVYTTFNNSYYGASGVTFYFGGITSPTDIKLLLI